MSPLCFHAYCQLYSFTCSFSISTIALRWAYSRLPIGIFIRLNWRPMFVGSLSYLGEALPSVRPVLPPGCVHALPGSTLTPIALSLERPFLFAWVQLTTLFTCSLTNPKWCKTSPEASEMKPSPRVQGPFLARGPSAPLLFLVTAFGDVLRSSGYFVQAPEFEHLLVQGSVLGARHYPG